MSTVSTTIITMTSSRLASVSVRASVSDAVVAVVAVVANNNFNNKGHNHFNKFNGWFTIDPERLYYA